MEQGINAVIYGPNMVGKTWLACTAPGPRLFLDVEGKTRFLRTRKVYWDPNQPPPKDDGTWDTCIVSIRHHSDIDKVIPWLAAGKHPFRSSILDSVSDYQERIIMDRFGINPLQKQDWGTVLRIGVKAVTDLRALTTHPTNPLDAVILTARVMHIPGDEPRQIPALQGAMADKLPHMMDLCAYLSSVPDKNGVPQRYLLTQPAKGYVTGESLGGALPRVMPEPDISQMIELVRDKLFMDTHGAEPAE